MKSVWLLTQQQDYESREVHSLYEEKPYEEILFGLLCHSFGYAFSEEVLFQMACKLYENEEVRILSLFTWRLEERNVN